MEGKAKVFDGSFKEQDIVVHICSRVSQETEEDCRVRAAVHSQAQSAVHSSKDSRTARALFSAGEIDKRLGALKMDCRDLSSFMSGYYINHNFVRHA